MPDQSTTKHCPRCNQEKPLAEFYFKDKAKGTLQSHCKRCTVDASNARYAAKMIPIREARSKVPPPTTVTCSQCGIEKPTSEFHRRGGTIRGTCKVCRNAAKAEYRRSHLDTIHESGKAYYGANREEIAERQRKWREANPDRIREIQRKSRDKQAARIREYNKAYREDNPDLYRAAYNNRRARIKGNGGRYTVAEWEAIKKRQDYTCLMCGKREPEIALTVDHIIPIKLGGTNDAVNLQGLCGHCNSTKSARILDLR